MKPLIRLFLLVVCAGFGFTVGGVVGTGAALGLSEQGLGWTGVDFDRVDKFDRIIFGTQNEMTWLDDIPADATTEEIVQGFLVAQGKQNLTTDEFEELIQLSVESATRTHSHSKTPAGSWVLGALAAVMGLVVAWFCGRWLWQFLYAEGD